MTQKELHKTVKDIHNLLSSNGSVGLCEKVRINETNIEYLKTKIKSIPKIWRQLLRDVIYILTFLILLYITYNKFGGKL